MPDDSPLARQLRAAPLAYGCWRLAGSEGQPPEPTAAPGIRAVLAALEAGYQVFDLADIYAGGRAEEIFGAALRESPGSRSRILVVGKCGIRRAGDPDPAAPYRYDFSAAHLERSVEGSLRRMGLDHLDLLLLHRPDYLMDPAAVAGAFSRLRDSGKVRGFGVSNFRPGQADLLQRACPFPLLVHQVEISLCQRQALDDGTLDQCLAAGWVPQAWSPLAQGLLPSGRAAGMDPADAPRWAALAAALERLGAAHGVEPAVIALAWLRRHPAGIQPVVGTVQPGRIRSLARVTGVELSPEEWYGLLTTARGGRLP